MTTRVTTAIALTGVLVSGWLVQRVKDADIRPSSEIAGLEAHESNAGASLLGQFRTSAATWLWVRTDLYLHNGVEMRPRTSEEQSGGRQAESAAEGEAEIGHNEDIVTVIPSAERDFRGVFGEVERQVAAYKGMQDHHHNDPVTTLPLFRLMTWIDPKFIPGWTTAAFVMTTLKDPGANASAKRFLLDGLVENPDCLAILAAIGRHEVVVERREDLAIKYLELARVAGRKNLNFLSEDERTSLQECYRWLAFAYRDIGQVMKMQEVAREGLRYFPEDVPLAGALKPTCAIVPRRA